MSAHTKEQFDMFMSQLKETNTNSSLKFEIKAKQFYAASQRVL